MAYCKECGTEIGEGVKFCPECGAAQEAVAPVKEKAEKKKGASTSGLLFLAIVAVCLIAAVIALSSNSDSGPAPTRKPTTFEVEYRITGTTPLVDLTYNNDQGNTEQLDNVKVPWSKVYDDWPLGEFAYISAQNQRDWGSVKCQLFVNGEEIESAESSGEYVIADCSDIIR